VTESNSVESLLTLLQLSDSAIPIGGYSHSWGLETWIQNDVICDVVTAQEAIQQLLVRSIAPQDGIACGIAHRYCSDRQPQQMAALNDLLTASKWSKEIFQASIRMGHRLLKLALETNVVPSLHGLDTSCEYHHSTIFGWLAACAGASELSTISAYLQNSSNGLISACVRLIPLGHTDGQRITVAMRTLISDLAQKYSQRQLDEISSFAPLHEAACFKHESLYSRLFQS